MKRSWAILVLAACERYEAPPTPVIVGAEQGEALLDSKAPLVVDFGEPIVAAGLKAQVAFDQRDIEGELIEPLSVLPSTALVDGARATLNHTDVFPVGPKLVLVVDPGLRGTNGTELRHRVEVPFSYGVTCAGGPTKLASGTYFMVLIVKNPVPVQLPVFAALTVDAKTGTLSGQFTNAQRRPDQTCPSACTNGTVCRLLPAPACVLPSTPPGTVDEYPDWFANPTPPTGYRFEAAGCAADTPDGATGLFAGPATMVVESPDVKVIGLRLTSSFEPDGGVIRSSGTLTADDILLGGTSIGNGNGTMTARQIP
jgi:hypothetical protein